MEITQPSETFADNLAIFLMRARRQPFVTFGDKFSSTSSRFIPGMKSVDSVTRRESLNRFFFSSMTSWVKIFAKILVAGVIKANASWEARAAEVAPVHPGILIWISHPTQPMCLLIFPPFRFYPAEQERKSHSHIFLTTSDVIRLGCFPFFNSRMASGLISKRFRLELIEKFQQIGNFHRTSSKFHVNDEKAMKRNNSRMHNFQDSRWPTLGEKVRVCFCIILCCYRPYITNINILSGE